MLSPTLFPESTEKAGPKHSTSVPSSSVVAGPLSVDEKEVALVVINLAVKTPPGPQLEVGVLCGKAHELPLLPPTLQMVVPVLSPATAQLNVMTSLGQVGGAAVNCPPTSPGDK